MDQPIAYFITWTTYGTWLHGDERGSFARREGYVRPSERRRLAAETVMSDDPVRLSPDQRAAVGAAVREHCASQGWELHACNVRTNHVHVVVSARVKGTVIRSQLKAKASARLSEIAGLVAESKDGARKWWTEKGDIQPVWDDRHLEAVIRYVDEQQ